MIKKKICLIGAYAVGKTSLVRQFVSGIFSDDYLTTVGVKIDQRKVVIEDGEGVWLRSLGGEPEPVAGDRRGGDGASAGF